MQALVDEVYTLYGFVKVDVGAKINCQFYCGNSVPGESSVTVSTVGAYKNGVKLASFQNIESFGEFSWIAYSFKIVTPGVIRAGFENTVAALEMYVCGLKMVKGNYDQTVKWTPAPSDWVSDPINYTWKPI